MAARTVEVYQRALSNNNLDQLTDSLGSWTGYVTGEVGILGLAFETWFPY